VSVTCTGVGGGRLHTQNGKFGLIRRGGVRRATCGKPPASVEGQFGWERERGFRKEKRQHSQAAHSQWIESNAKNKHKARPARLNATLQKRKLGDNKVSARGNWEVEK
jgi:hypothetical protein